MTPDKFTYWLQGFFELSGSRSLDEQQVQIIKDHLALCFKKETPTYNYPNEFKFYGLGGDSNAYLLKSDSNEFQSGWVLDQPIQPEVFVTC